MKSDYSKVHENFSCKTCFCNKKTHRFLIDFKMIIQNQYSKKKKKCILLGI